MSYLIRGCRFCHTVSLGEGVGGALKIMMTEWWTDDDSFCLLDMMTDGWVVGPLATDDRRTGEIYWLAHLWQSPNSCWLLKKFCLDSASCQVPFVHLQTQVLQVSGLLLFMDAGFCLLCYMRLIVGIVCSNLLENNDANTKMNVICNRLRSLIYFQLSKDTPFSTFQGCPLFIVSPLMCLGMLDI